MYKEKTNVVFKGNKIKFYLCIEKDLNKVKISIPADTFGNFLAQYYSDSKNIDKQYSNRTRTGTDFYSFCPQNATYFVGVYENAISLYVTPNTDSDICTGDLELDDILCNYKERLSNYKINQKKYGENANNVAKKLGVAFIVSIIFGGNEKKIMKFINSLQDLINSKDFIIPSDIEDLKSLKIDFQGAEPLRLYSYVKNCLEDEKILVF